MNMIISTISKNRRYTPQTIQTIKSYRNPSTLTIHLNKFQNPPFFVRWESDCVSPNRYFGFSPVILKFRTEKKRNATGSPGKIIISGPRCHTIIAIGIKLNENSNARTFFTKRVTFSMIGVLGVSNSNSMLIKKLEKSYEAKRGTWNVERLTNVERLAFSERRAALNSQLSTLNSQL